MSDPYTGEIRMFAGTFAPRAWAFCDGQLLSVSQNDALFSLLGTIYGGDGETTFGLPDFRGRIPIHFGSGPGLSTRQIGSKSGAEDVTLTATQLPSHNHGNWQATSAAANSSDPAGKMLAPTQGIDAYREGDEDPQNLSIQVVENTGGSQRHTNMMPFLCINFIIALLGIYPSE